MTERYKFLKDVFNKDNKIEDEYIHYRSVIEYKLNNGDIPYLDWWIIFMQRKYLIEGKKYERDIDLLPDVLELIGRLLKEKKVKVEIYEVIEKEDGKDWDAISKGYLDPCKIEDEKKLSKKIKEWQEWVIQTYKRLSDKYGERSANILFDLIGISKSNCYDGEIRID